MSIPKFFMRSFARPEEAMLSSFGPLERDVLSQVWRQGEVNVRMVADALDGRAYTTIMTTLDRLFKKGLLERRKEGRAFLYTARYSAAELEAGVAQNVIASLLDAGTNGAEPMLACIVEAVSDCDRELLDKLEELIRDKRRALGVENE